MNRKKLNYYLIIKISVLKNFTYSLRKSNYSPLWAFILYLFFVYGHTQAQTRAQRLDSIAQTYIDKLEQVSNDTLRIDLFNEISWTLKETDTLRARAYARSAVALAKKTGNKKGLATAYNRLGIIDGKLLRFKAAIVYYDSALVIEKSISDLNGIARASNQLAAAHKSLGNYRAALSHIRTAVNALEQSGTQKNLATALTIMGNIFKDLSLYDSALVYLNKAYDIRLALKSLTGQAESLLGLGSLYDAMNNHSKSLEFNTASLLLYDSLNKKPQMAKALTNIGNAHLSLGKDSLAESSYLRSLKLKVESGDTNNVAVNYNNLGKIYEFRKEYDKAEDYHIRARDIYLRNDDPQIVNSYFNLGNIANARGRNNEALNSYMRALDKAEALEKLKHHSFILRDISKVLATIGRTSEALKYRERYSRLLNDISKDILNASNMELEIQHERSRNELLQSETERQRLAFEKQRILIWSLTGTILLLALLFFTFFRNARLKHRNLISKQNEDLQKQRIKELIKEKELEAMNAMMEGQENERLRIARDLHDRLGGTLSIVKMHFKSVEESIEVLKEKNVKQYKEANTLLDEACEEVRKIAHDMASGVLMKFGLVAALEALKETVETAGQLKINLIDIGLEERLSYEYEINIYRIIQELLTNTLKHAKAKEMSVQIFRKENNLSIVVEDDGVGFDPDDNSTSRGIGLKNIESRVYKFEGEVNVDSGKGAGTTVTIDLPLKIKEL